MPAPNFDFDVITGPSIPRPPVPPVPPATPLPAATQPSAPRKR